MIKKIWKSYRLINLVIVGLTLFAFCRLNGFYVNEAHELPGFWGQLSLFILVGSVLIHGNLKNDFFDQKVDTENQKAFNAYFQFSNAVNRVVSAIALVIGIIAAVYLSYHSSYFFFFYWFVAHGLLWVYNLYAKKVMILGNFLVSLITSFTVFLPYIFYVNYAQNCIGSSCDLITLKSSAWSITLLFFIFSFIINWNREVVKDIKDQYGDRVLGYKTLPLVWGLEKTMPFILYGHLMLTITLSFMFFYSLSINHFPSMITLGIIEIIMLFCWILFVKEKFTLLSRLYKLVMALGILVVFLYPHEQPHLFKPHEFADFC